MLLWLQAVDVGVIPCCRCRQLMLVSLLWLQAVDVGVLVVVAGS